MKVELIMDHFSFGYYTGLLVGFTAGVLLVKYGLWGLLIVIIPATILCLLMRLVADALADKETT